MKRILIIAALVLPLMAAKSCGGVPVAATAGGPSVQVWTGLNPPAESGGKVWVPSGSNWKLLPWAAAIGITGGIIAGDRSHHRSGTIGVRFHEDVSKVDLCFDKDPNFLLAEWLPHTRFRAPDPRLRCLTLTKIGLREPFSRAKYVLYCITTMIAEGRPTVTAGRVIWAWRGGWVNVGADGEIVSAYPPADMTWKECMDA